MKIVIASADNKGLEGQVSAHFGRCDYYTIVEVEDGQITDSKVVDNPTLQNHQPGMAPRFIHEELGADVMLTGGMGPRAIEMFLAWDISCATGASGRIKDAIDAYLAGKLGGVEACSHSDHEEGNHEDGVHEHHHHAHGQEAATAAQAAASEETKMPTSERDPKVANPVVIPSLEDKGFMSLVDSRFGRAHFFALVDLDSKKLLKMVPNEAANAGHGAGTNAAQVVAELGGKSTVAGHFGPKAAQALKAMDVQLWEIDSDELKLSDIVNQLRAGALKPAEA